MKIGFKLFSHEYHLADILADIADFFEVYAEPNMDYKKLVDIDVPFTIHAPHHEHGFDAGSLKKMKYNKELMKKTFAAAELLNSKHIVVHAGSRKNKESEQNAINFFKDIGDKRLLLENLIINYNETEYLFSTPEQMSIALKETKLKPCFDFNHARLTAQFLDLNYKTFIKSFVKKVRPNYFHISDAKLGIREDVHLHLGDGNLDLKFFKSLIPSNALVVFETGYDSDRERKRHIKELELFRSL